MGVPIRVGKDSQRLDAIIAGLQLEGWQCQVDLTPANTASAVSA